MKRIYSITVIFVALVFAKEANGQTDLGQLLKGNSADANYLAAGYLTPFINSVSNGLNSGWYNSAKSHKLLGFDITASASLIYFPSSDQFYKVDNNRLSNIQLTTGASAPTIFGPKDIPVYAFKAPLSGTFNGPPGVDPNGAYGMNAIPIPLATIGIGLPKGTELKLRFIPTINTTDFSVSLFGIGVMHDIKQYIPKIKIAPFDLSAFIGYTSFKTEVSLDKLDPSRKASSEFTATTVQAIISKKLSVVTFYGSVGYNFNSGSFKVIGSYDAGTGLLALTNPVNLSASSSGPRVTAGLRLKLLIFTIHGDYTLQTYNVLNLGFGLSVR